MEAPQGLQALDTAGVSTPAPLLARHNDEVPGRPGWPARAD
jgi:hypothetical protein